ncbi:MAG: hypothetical protein HY867_04960 [Chloroflexi bacterium]|nr:hypothetical protein [Chloroflexota bacterium]
METITFDLSWLCMVIPLGIIVVAAILGTRSRLRYASQIREALARGAFKELNAPEMKSRIRRLAVVALIGAIGMCLSFAFVVLQQISGVNAFFDLIVAVGLVFGIVASITGLMMRREIDKRL